MFQDAVLFSGTVRENLDPFNEHSDQELLDALDRVQLGANSKTPAASHIPSREASNTRLSALLDDADTASTDSTIGTPVAVGKAKVALDTEVSAGGASLSQGQRQLLAMARAMLRRSNLVIADEATASIDMATDIIIQQAIRTEFADACVITIAHRL
jgi:ABC-type multidrug transport system fused ATPase/permease subunit